MSLFARPPPEAKRARPVFFSLSSTANAIAARPISWILRSHRFIRRFVYVLRPVPPPVSTLPIENSYEVCVLMNAAQFRSAVHRFSFQFAGVALGQPRRIFMFRELYRAWGMRAGVHAASRVLVEIYSKITRSALRLRRTQPRRTTPPLLHSALAARIGPLHSLHWHLLWRLLQPL